MTDLGEGQATGVDSTGLVTGWSQGGGYHAKAWKDGVIGRLVLLYGS